MNRGSSLLLASIFGCAPEYHFDELPLPESVRGVASAEACPPPGHRSTSAIREVIADCSVGSLALGIDAVDVDPYQADGVVYVVDLSDPNDRGEHWALSPWSSSVPPTWPGECLDVRYWSYGSRVTAFDELFDDWVSGHSRYRCGGLAEATSLTYAYAILDGDGEVLDCALVGAAPEALRASQDRGPDFPLEACQAAPFELWWAREPHGR